ncbi:putative G-protein coupled receptor 32 [Glossophaga mutica]
MNHTSAPGCQPAETRCLRLLTVATLSVSFGVGVVANGLVLWMTAFRMARTVTTTWFFHLSLADFAVLASLPVAIHSLASDRWPLEDVACRLYMAFLSFTFFTSVCLLILISVDRCVSVLCPIWVRKHRTVRRASWLAGAAWLLAAAASSPYLRLQAAEEPQGCKYCYFKFNTGNEGRESSGDWGPGTRQMYTVVTITYFVVGFLVPLVVISTCAHLLLAKLRREGWVHAQRPKRLLLVLVSAFFALWFPFNLALLVHLGLPNPHNPQMLLILWATFSLGCLNSCLNPFLYVFVGRNFQEKFFQSLPSALARAFGEEGLFIHPAPKGKCPGDDGELNKVEAENLPM